MLTHEELAAIYGQINESSATGKRNRALLQTMADCGLRVSEAVNLRTGDLQREDGRITTLTVHWGKGGKDRTAFCTPQLSDKLLRWLDARTALGIGRGPVFATIKHGAGRTLLPRYVQYLVSALAERAGIEKRVTPHTLRHTAATRKLKATGNLRIVQDDLGHARLETTRIYTHVVDAERQEAAESLPPVDGEEVKQRDEHQEQIAALQEQIADLQKQVAALAAE